MFFDAHVRAGRRADEMRGLQRVCARCLSARPYSGPRVKSLPPILLMQEKRRERIGKLEIMGNDNAERERARQHEEDRRFLAGWGGGVGFSLQLASAGRRNGVSPPPQS